VYIITTLMVLAAQLVLIAALLAQRAKRRRAETSLRHRETTLRTSYERIRLLAGKLITAQETTRANVARDLHDDVCQDLVGVSMGINSLIRTHGRIQDAHVQRSLSDLQAWALQLVESVRRLSHELHPASLQLVGLASALKTHCLEVEKRYDAQVAFHASGAFRGLDPDCALCLFRIAQEALRNGAIHGDARRLGVSLARSGDHIELTVTDDGAGFELETVRHQGDGLGLVSIEERAHLVGGTVEIVTRPGQGTAIRARVPARYQDPPAEQEPLERSDARAALVPEGA
jgi:two-component system sensor histidine kinase UhpB